jgi:glycosyltransferase involved in cell wall biosynthesis
MSLAHTSRNDKGINLPFRIREIRAQYSNGTLDSLVSSQRCYVKFRKVCFFLPSSNRDGGELAALECLDALKALGMQVHAVMPKKGPLIEDLQARQIGYQIIPYKVWVEPPIPIWKGFLFTLWNFFIIYPAVFLVGRRKYDLIITNTINICIGAFVAKLFRLPHVWYILEFGSEDHGWRFHLGKKFPIWVMDRFSDLCLAVSRAVAQKYQMAGITASKVQYLYHPMDVTECSSADISLDKKTYRLTCVMVARLQEGKRQEDAIRAIGELRDQSIHVQLWLVGGGEQNYFNFLKRLVQENTLTDQVRFFGQVKEFLSYIKKADVFLLCSRCEAFARVVVQAMKVGKPVVGTRSGGTVEQITDGFNGFLYEPYDHKDLAAKIKYFIDHPRVTQKMGENARHWAMRTFSRESYQEKISNILSQL